MPKAQDPHRRLRERLRERRKALDFSIADVAQITGVGASRIRRIEQDPDNSPRVIQIARLATLYGLEANELFALIDVPERLTAASQPADPPTSTDYDDGADNTEVRIPD